MTYRGKIKNGVVVIDGNPTLPEGADVELEVVDEAALKALWEDLRKLAGTVDGLPPDMAENHDHYAHGAPKRKQS
ncbi:MAG TPA: hypothetical protein VF669_09725 [Tepidisphaeraceae bacterium]|jgi:hypothetical protein